MKLTLIIVFILLTPQVYANSLSGVITRAERGLLECTTELVRIDNITRDNDTAPLNIQELTRLYKEVDVDYGKGQGHAECLSNIDSIIEWMERN